MTGQKLCSFCRAPEDMDGMKLYNNCNLSNGGPCPACIDYMAMDAKISAAKQVLDDLLAERSKIRSRVNQNHDLLISRVPMEIVRSVFQFCLPPDDVYVFDDDNQDIMNFAEKDRRMISGPLFLGSICKAWRNIAWRTEPLWGVFRLFIHWTSDPSYIDLAREWLDRAGQHPLCIRIFEPYHYDMTADDVALIALINEKSQQWKLLDLTASSQLISYLTGEPGGAPNLQALTIAYNLATFEDERSPFSLAGTKPRPSRLVSHHCALRWICVEWETLTSVCLLTAYLEDGIELLRVAPRITECRLYQIVRKDRRWLPKLNQPIIHSALDSLEIEYDIIGDMNIQNIDGQSKAILLIFFESFIFPNLTNLKVKRSRSLENHLSWIPAIAHLATSPPPLKSLAIHYHGKLSFTESILLPFLQICLLLQDLEILMPLRTGMDKILDLFTEPSLQEKFLPNFRSLTLSVAHLGKEQEVLFWSHICKTLGTVPFKNLKLRIQLISWWDYEIRSKDVALKLLQLQKEGIALRLEVTDDDGNDAFRRVIGEHAELGDSEAASISSALSDD